MDSTDAILNLYSTSLPLDWFANLRSELKVSGCGGLFSPAFTCWLMIQQRLERTTVEETWLSVSPELACRFSPTSKRACSGVLSPYGGGYGHARNALPVEIVQTMSDRLFTQLSLEKEESGISAFALDGTSLTPDGSAALRKAYPPCRNQHGESHFPVIRMVVAHCLRSGMALRPAWGPMYGKDAIAEQPLALQILNRLPEGSLVVADRNFGVFSITWSLKELSHPCLVRMTEVRAKSMAGTNLTIDQDKEIVWIPSAHERRKHKDIPQDARIEGRLIVRHVLQQKRMVKLILFACDTELSGDELAELYAKRWLIEADLRTLKHTLGVDRPSARLPDVLAKELILGVCAYNLVRSVAATAAHAAGVSPRQMSFTRVAACVKAYAPRLEAAKDDQERQRLIKELLERAGARKLVPRVRENPPRHIWNRTKNYKKRSATPIPKN